MITIRDRKDCCGCCACAAACPHGAIRMEQDGMGFRYPVIDKALCTDCGLCEEVCGFKKPIDTSVPAAYAIRFPDYLEGSQSGGLGYAVMMQAIRHGMVVYGAAMDDDFVVRHRRVVALEDLAPLRLSKYVQSDMDGIPAQVFSDLKAGRKVLFTGTPCQCAGVEWICRKYRENLLLADIVCRAVPSPAFWKGYLKEKSRSGQVRRVLFRDPALGWHNNLTRIDYQDHTEYNGDYYFFCRNGLVNRPSCGQCPYTNAHASDITMGDCWGVENILPGFADDDRGCSLLLIHSLAGEIFTSALEGCERRKISAGKVLAYTKKGNSPLARKVKKYYLCKGYAYVNARFGEHSLRERFKRLLRKLNPANTKLYRRLSR